MPLLLLIVGVSLIWSHGLGARVQSAREHHEAGIAFHLARSLDEASQAYDLALSLDPPQEPDPRQRARILALAPRVYVNRAEPFALKDAAAVLHPRLKLIAYHLFWADDVDFPDDNDPSDHEVVWVEYDGEGRCVRVVTLFHGRVVDGGVAATREAAAHGGRARIDVQWGKHGPMPAGWQTALIRTEASDEDTEIPADRELTLLDYNRLTWKKLSGGGTRGRAHPLAIRHRWPNRFAGDETAFMDMTREVDVRDMLDRRAMMLVSEWNSATLARHLLFYNFRPKLEWPESAEIRQEE